MHAVVERIDDFGRPAWIALMVVGFIVFWPIGLALLAYLLWSGRMGCRRYGDVEQWRERAPTAAWERKRERWEERCSTGARHRDHGLRPSGNRAFDEYREEALRRLEEEATEFRSFLERLRMAKDRAEFDEFMRERRNRQSTPATTKATGAAAPRAEGTRRSTQADGGRSADRGASLRR